MPAASPDVLLWGDPRLGNAMYFNSRFLAALLDWELASFGPAEMDLTWLLRLADSIVTYRARYMARPEWLPVLDLLIRDEANPRSIAFQVNGLRDYSQRLTDMFGDFGSERFHGALRGLLQLNPAADLQPGNERLLARLDEWQAAAYRHGEQLSLRFFSHVGEASTQTFAT